MQIDIFTLFPHWFDWFRGQRHVANVVALGTSIDCIDYRAHTPLKAGQVDDTPFGGGAGMVLRVDVVEAALRARYGADPVELRERRRIVALTPGGGEIVSRISFTTTARSSSDAGPVRKMMLRAWPSSPMIDRWMSGGAPA